MKKSTLITFLVVTIFTVTLTVHAAGSNFVPIAPVPGAGGGLATDSKDLGGYINSLFAIALAVGAVLAAIFIAIGGFEYMFSGAISGQKDGRERITNALYGLGILLVAYLILYIIGGPNAVSLNIFN